MFDKEKMFKEKTAIKLNKKEYDELKGWCDDENIKICSYNNIKQFCINFEEYHSWWAETFHYKREGYKILSLDDIRINEIGFNNKAQENKMKYKLVKDLSGESIVENACHTQFELFIKKYGYYDNIKWTQENEDFIIEQKGWIAFFIDNGFIEENKKRLEYDENKIYVSVYSGAVFKLTKLNDKFAFVCLNKTKQCTLNGVWDSGQEAIDIAIKNNYTIKAFDTLVEVIDYIK